MAAEAIQRAAAGRQRWRDTGGAGGEWRHRPLRHYWVQDGIVAGNSGSGPAGQTESPAWISGMGQGRVPAVHKSQLRVASPGNRFEDSKLRHSSVSAPIDPIQSLRSRCRPAGGSTNAIDPAGRGFFLVQRAVTVTGSPPRQQRDPFGPHQSAPLIGFRLARRAGSDEAIQASAPAPAPAPAPAGPPMVTGWKWLWGGSTSQSICTAMPDHEFVISAASVKVVNTRGTQLAEGVTRAGNGQAAGFRRPYPPWCVGGR